MEIQAPNRVVIISDCTDFAYSEMRGTILRNAKAANVKCEPLIEPLVPTEPFSVINAGFALRLMAEAYGSGTLFMVIMNSLRERTERIVGRTETGGLFFEGTNTGAVGWLLQDFGLAESYEVKDPGFIPFGGKYVHSPAVGRLLAGVPMQELGDPMSPSNIRSVLPSIGQIVHIDNFGNAKFLMDKTFKVGDRLIVECGEWCKEAIFGRRMMDHADGQWVVYPGSSMNLFELGEVRGPGLLSTSARIGDFLKVYKA